MADKNYPKGGRGPGKRAKYGPELAQRTRAAILNALDVLDKRGKVISEILADKFEEDPFKFMELAAKFMPKEGTLTIERSRNTEHLTEDELSERIAGLQQRIAELQSGAVGEATGEEQVH